MLNRKEVLSLAVILACGGVAMAETPSSYLTLDAAAPAPRAPLMEGLDRIGAAKPLDDLHLNIGGYIESGYTFNFNHHNGTVNGNRTLDREVGNHYQLDQVALFIERAVDRKSFDVGGRIDWVYGTDSQWLHSSGLNFYGSSNPQLDTEYQFDLVQAYVDVNLPIGSGLMIRTGKFATLVGAETINPTTNAFYSHSNLFNFAEPLTHTGVMANYQFTDSIGVWAGITRGWDQSTKDNNDAINGVLSVTYTPSKQLTLTSTVISGPEDTDDNGHYRTLVDFVANYQLTDALSLGANVDIGYDGAGDATRGSNDWYGVALYQGYAINDYLTFNLREEWFHDGDGARLLDVISGSNVNVYEITMGFTIKPLPKDKIGQNLKIRPEFRWDFAEDKIFNNGIDSNQATIGCDVIFTF